MVKEHTAALPLSAGGHDVSLLIRLAHIHNSIIWDIPQTPKSYRCMKPDIKMLIVKREKVKSKIRLSRINNIDGPWDTFDWNVIDKEIIRLKKEQSSLYKYLPTSICTKNIKTRVVELAEFVALCAKKGQCGEAIKSTFSAYAGICKMNWSELNVVKSYMTFSLLKTILDITLEEHLKLDKKGILNTEKIVELKLAYRGLCSIIDTNWTKALLDASDTHLLMLNDPSRAYGRMDEATQISYLDKLSYLSRIWGITESSVVKSALELSLEGVQQHGENTVVECHIGYYLIDQGIERLSLYLGLKQTNILYKKSINKHISSIYVILRAVLTILIMVAMTIVTSTTDINITPLIFFQALMFPLVYIGAANLTNLLWPRPLVNSPMHRMSYASEVPQHCATLVAISSIVKDKNDIDSIVESMEDNFLRNRQDGIYFAAAVDLQDANKQNLESDSPVMTYFISRIEYLNNKYPVSKTESTKFVLFYRDRQWSTSESCWMGYERKRGKTNALISSLMGRGDCDIQIIAGKVAEKQFRFLITLDDDTVMPFESASQLIGVIAHPLNMPVIKNGEKFVSRGYAILQPRMTNTIPMTGASLYSRSRTWTSLERYSGSNSEFYSEALSHGSYLGKGIIDINAFDACVGKKLPENVVLSHDILEGDLARTAYVSDISFAETAPRSPFIELVRLERWIRGDWQNLFWLIGHPKAEDELRLRDLSLLCIIKAVDGLISSLKVPVLAGILFLLCISNTSRDAAFLIFLIFLGNAVFEHGVKRLIIGCPDTTAGGKTQQTILWLSSISVIFPYKAYLIIRAIGRAFWRVIITKKNALRWTSFKWVNEDHSFHQNELTDCLRVNLVFLAFIIATIYPSDGLSIAAITVVCIIWIIGPVLFLADNGYVHRVVSHEDAKYLENLANDTWKYFQYAVSSETNWLPLDNTSSHQHCKAVSQTSPTNIGLYLAGVVAAADINIITIEEAISRIESTLYSVKHLEKSPHGHLFNWYDVYKACPMEPRYVSSVDCGNFVLALMIVSRFLSDCASPAVEYPDLRKIDQYAQRYEEGYFFNLSFINTYLLKINLDKCLPYWVVSSRITKLLYKHTIICVKVGGQIYSAILKNTRKILGYYLFDQEMICHGTLNSSQGSFDHNRIVSIKKMLNEAISADFNVFVSEDRKLIVNGLHAPEFRQSDSKYDLLASEARIASYVAIAKDGASPKVWYNLCRDHVSDISGYSLISWGGSLFEYIMPALFMPFPTGTVLYNSMVTSVRTQIKKKIKGIGLWGISECGYAEKDSNGNYSYGPFGSDSLALDPNLSGRAVYSPYSTLMASLIDPTGAVANLRLLERLGARGSCGFYEALDFGVEPSGKSLGSVVEQHMAHHAAMSLIAIGHVLGGAKMHRRFMDEPLLRSAAVLLMEKWPGSWPVRTTGR